jgi:hypothetical protein
MEYFATKDGRIFSTRQQMKVTTHHSGYLVLTISKQKQRKQYRVHRFVWEYFNGPIPPDKVIDHIDGDKTNNALSNLRLVSNKENIQHARSMLGDWNLKGQDVYCSKLTNDQFMKMVDDFVSGMTNDDIALKYGLHSRYVSLIRHKRRWKHLWEMLPKDIVIPSGVLKKKEST